MQDTVSYTVHSFLLTRRGEQEYRGEEDTSDALSKLTGSLYRLVLGENDIFCLQWFL